MIGNIPVLEPEKEPYGTCPRFISRRLVLSPDDMDPVAAAIQAAAPGTVFVAGNWPSSPEKPKLVTSDRIMLTCTERNPGRTAEIYPCIGTWRPDWRWSPISEKWLDLQETKWHRNGPIRFCAFLRTEKLPGCEVECLKEGEIYFRCHRERPEDAKLVQKIMRSLNKLISNKNLGHT